MTSRVDIHADAFHDVEVVMVTTLERLHEAIEVIPRGSSKTLYIHGLASVRVRELADDLRTARALDPRQGGEEVLS